MDRGAFLKEVELRLGAAFPSLAERCTVAVFKVLRQRVEPGQGEHIATHLPKEFKYDWEVGGASFRRMNKHEFLEAVKNGAGFYTTDEAFLATQAVFGALKVILPGKDVEDTAAELPEDLREIWRAA